MRKMLAVEHLRAVILIVFGLLPVIGIVLYTLVFGMFGEDATPSFRVMVGVEIAFAILVAGAITLYVVLVSFKPRRYLDDMAELARGECWAHWTYDEQQWRTANAIEVARQRRGYVYALWAVGGGVVIAVAALLSDSAKWVFAGIVTAFIGLALIATMALTGSALLARRERTGELWISATGVLRRPGLYSAFAPGGVLTEVALVGSPMRMVFTSMGISRSGPRYHQSADILVPAGREDEARALVERFNAEMVATG